MRFWNLLLFLFASILNAGFYSDEAWNTPLHPEHVEEPDDAICFYVQQDTKLFYGSGVEYRQAKLLEEMFLECFDIHLNQAETEPDVNAIIIKIDTDLNPKTEQYSLNIGEGGKIIISAHDSRGIWNAIGSFSTILKDSRLRLFPKGILAIPAAVITDSPDYLGWRGLNLQMCFGREDPESIRKMIDMAFEMHMNILVFEIGKNWQSVTNGANGNYSYDTLSELVVYAENRGIDVVPSMNLLGHLERGPNWQSVVSGGINMSDPDNYLLLSQMLDEIVDIFDRPRYFHGGMDEALAVVQGNSSLLSLPEKTVLVNHILEVNNLLNQKNMQLIIWHDLLVAEGETGEIENGTLGPYGTASVRDLLPSNIVINVWDYDNYGGANTIELFNDYEFDLINTGWMGSSVRKSAEVATANEIMGIVGSTWCNVELSDLQSGFCIWNHGHYNSIPTLTGFYCWNSSYDLELSCDPSMFSISKRFTNSQYKKINLAQKIELDTVVSHRNIGDDSPSMIRSILGRISQNSSGLVYLNRFPFVVREDSYCEIQTSFTGEFLLQDHLESAEYAFLVTVFRDSIELQRFYVDGVNRGRSLNEIIIYTNNNVSTGTNNWGGEVAVADGKVVQKQVFSAGNSRVPRNGFIVSAHGDKVSLLNKIEVGDEIVVERLYQNQVSEIAFNLSNREPANTSFVNIPTEIADANVLSFLHSTKYRTLNGTLIGWYRVIYDDGIADNINVVYGENITSFLDSQSLYSSPVLDDVSLGYCDSKLKEVGDNFPELVYIFNWHNPYPHKRIVSIKMVPVPGAIATGWTLLGITGINHFGENGELYADLDCNGKIDIKDFMIFTQNWLRER